ncbi:hypothetical protein J6X04_00170 [Candidatus Saccharibacteria bacterium]|nr:hypothetical protein [Candidatus Saccharibacteria bacterium]
MKKNKLLLALVAVLGGLSLVGLNVFADDTGGTKFTMTISPPRQEITLIPGEVFEGTVEVSNPANAEQNLNYSVTVGSFNFGKDENGKTDYSFTDVDTITSYNQIMEWITLGKESGSVAPNTTDVIPFTITVPEDAPAGGQYATIIVQNDTEENDGNSGNVTIQNEIRFAAQIIAKVGGETREKGLIIENSIPSFLFGNPLSTTSVVKNEGNVHTDAEVTLQVWPLFSSEEIYTNEEDPTTVWIVPNTERLHVEERDLPMVGIFKVRQTVKIFGEESVMEKVVFVCPLWLLFIIIFAIILLIMWWIRKSKSQPHTKNKKSEE